MSDAVAPAADDPGAADDAGAVSAAGDGADGGGGGGYNEANGLNEPNRKGIRASVIRRTHRRQAEPAVGIVPPPVAPTPRSACKCAVSRPGGAPPGNPYIRIKAAVMAACWLAGVGPIAEDSEPGEVAEVTGEVTAAAIEGEVPEDGGAARAIADDGLAAAVAEVSAPAAEDDAMADDGGMGGGDEKGIDAPAGGALPVGSVPCIDMPAGYAGDDFTLPPPPPPVPPPAYGINTGIWGIKPGAAPPIDHSQSMKESMSGMRRSVPAA